MTPTDGFVPPGTGGRSGKPVVAMRPETAWIVNCTGPERDVTRQSSPLVCALLRRGLLAADALGLGVHTGPAGELRDAHGRPVPRMLALGAWRIADLWESTAVPELRQQAADVAERLSIELAPGSAACARSLGGTPS